MSGGAATNPFLGQSNPYLQQNIDNVNQDVVRSYNQTAVPGQITAGIKSGSFGNSGLQQMQLQDQQNLQKTLAQNAASMRGADYNQQQQMYQWQKGLDEQQRQFNTGASQWDKQFGLASNNQNFNQGLANRQFAEGQRQFNTGANQWDKQFGLTQQAQNFNQGLARDQFGLGAQNQFFNQGLAADQNRYNQNMGWANYGLGAQNQAFNQDMARNQFDANQYWTGQNFDAGRYDTTFNQNQQQFSNYLNLLGQANALNQQDIGYATNIYNTPLNYQQMFGNMASQYGGLGGGSSQDMTGNPLLGAAGGYMAGSKLGGSK